jgi:hypothetical protein
MCSEMKTVCVGSHAGMVKRSLKTNSDAYL